MELEAAAPRRERGRQRREAMVQAAIDLVRERGPNDVRLIDVGERVGTTHAAVLYHFSSRRDLLLAVLQARDEHARRTWEAAFAAGGLQALRMLPRLAEKVLHETNFTKLTLVLAAESLGDDVVGRYFRTRYRWMRQGLTQAFRIAQQSGEARLDFDPAARAAEVISFTDGIAVQHLLDPTGVDIVAVYADFMESQVRDVTA